MTAKDGGQQYSAPLGYAPLPDRVIERIADLAVDIGEQTAFVVSGLFREFTDASHPEVRAASGAGADGAGDSGDSR